MWFLGGLYVFLSQAKEKYEKSLEELNKCTPQYTESMEQVFDQCQQHEVKRLTFLKEALLDIKRHLNLTENQRLDVLMLQVLYMSQIEAGPGSQYDHWFCFGKQSPELLSGCRYINLWLTKITLTWLLKYLSLKVKVLRWNCPQVPGPSIKICSD